MAARKKKSTTAFPAQLDNETTFPYQHKTPDGKHITVMLDPSIINAFLNLVDPKRMSGGQEMGLLRFSERNLMQNPTIWLEGTTSQHILKQMKRDYEDKKPEFLGIIEKCEAITAEKRKRSGGLNDDEMFEAEEPATNGRAHTVAKEGEATLLGDELGEGGEAVRVPKKKRVR